MADNQEFQPDSGERETHKAMKKNRQPLHPVLGPIDSIGEGDSRIVYNALPGLNGDDIFSEVKNEVYWQKMYHAQGEVPRLVCTQGLIDPTDGSMPVYRHPADQSLPLLHFSPMVQAIKERVEVVVEHPMNHVLIQLYRGGQDNISEHSDKTLDIIRGSSIVNVSIGAQRTMRLRTKRPQQRGQATTEDSSRRTQLVPMPHCSVFVLGLKSNMVWLHGINTDKRPDVERSKEELAFDGERISLTFRHIGSFLDSECRLIWGQGACEKEKGRAQEVVNGDQAATQAMINAFGFENQQTSFDWDAMYGHGFNVLHFKGSPQSEKPLLFLCDKHDSGVEGCLSKSGLAYEIAGVSRKDAGRDYSPEMCFRDTDFLKTQVYGHDEIIQYLTSKHRAER